MNLSPPDGLARHALATLVEFDIVPNAAGRSVVRRRMATNTEDRRERPPSTPSRPLPISWPLAQVARISPPRARPKVSKH